MSASPPGLRPAPKEPYRTLLARTLRSRWPALVAVVVVAIALRSLLEPGGATPWIAAAAVVIVGSVVTDRYARSGGDDGRRD